MNDDDSHDVNHTSATHDELNDHNSIDTYSYITLIIDIDENHERYSDNDDISSVFSDNSNNNNICSEEEDDIFNEYSLMNDSNNTNSYDLSLKIIWKTFQKKNVWEMGKAEEL